MGSVDFYILLRKGMGCFAPVFDTNKLTLFVGAIGKGEIRGATYSVSPWQRWRVTIGDDLQGQIGWQVLRLNVKM